MEVWGKSILGGGTAKISVHPEQVSHRSYVVGPEYAGPHRHLKCFGSCSEWDRVWGREERHNQTGFCVWTTQKGREEGKGQQERQLGGYFSKSHSGFWCLGHWAVEGMFSGIILKVELKDYVD